MKSIFLFISLFFFTYFNSFSQPNSSFAVFGVGSGINNNYVMGMTEFNGQLYVVGAFTNAGGVSVQNIARWNDKTWTSPSTACNGVINDVVVYNSELYVTGDFTSINGITANRIAKFNGVTWSAIGTGLNAEGKALHVFNSQLYVTGSFTIANGISANRIARLNGSTWSALGTGLNNTGLAITNFNNEIIAAGSFTTAGGITANRIAKWSGTTWSAIGTGMNADVNTIITYNSELYAGGSFTTAGGNSILGLSKWNGTNWGIVGNGLVNIVGTTVNKLAFFKSNLCLVGKFGITITGGGAQNLALWNGSNYIRTSGNYDANGLFSAAYEYKSELYFNGIGSSSEGGGAINNIGRLRILTNEPTVDASNINVVNVNDTIYLNWTKGNGKRRIVVVKQGNLNPTFIPIDSTNYTSANVNNRFGLSTNYNTGNFIVYDGNGSSVMITNLLPNTAYTCKIFEYNDSSNTRFNNFKNNLNTFRTFSTITNSQPTVKASNIRFFRRTPTTVDVITTPGNGVGRILIARKSSPPTFRPKDGVDYNANSIFGSVLTEVGNQNHVVYAGNNNIVTVTNLEPGNDYYFASFEYNITYPGSINYSPDSTVRKTYSVIAEPTIAASNATIIRGTTSATINWVNGNGKKRIVLGRVSTSIPAAPIDTIRYTANANFGSGSQIGTGNFVVFNGTGSSVTVNNLLQSNSYVFSIYEYNDSTGITDVNYLTTTAAYVNFKPLASEPTLNASNFIITGRTTTRVDYSFTKGNGTHRLIVARKISSNNILPADGNTYSITGDPIFGNGFTLISQGNYVISNTFGNFGYLDISQSGIGQYVISVYEYNKSEEGTENYLITNVLSDTVSTLMPEPTVQPSNVQFTSSTTNSLTLKWTKGNGKKTLVIVRANQLVNYNAIDTTTYIANPQFGQGQAYMTNNYVVYADTGSTFTLLNLQPNTQYYFQISSFNDSSLRGYSNYRNGNAVNLFRYTLNIEPTQIGNEIYFKNRTAIGFDYIFGNGNGNYRIVVVKKGSPVDRLPKDATEYIANSTFGQGDHLGNGNYVVYRGTGISPTNNLYGLEPGNKYYFAVFEYNYNTANTQTINYYTSNFLARSNATLVIAPTVFSSNLRITNKQSNSLNLSFTKGNGQKRLILMTSDLQLNPGLPLDTINYTGNLNYGLGQLYKPNVYVIYTGADTSININNLNPATFYRIYIYDYNDSIAPKHAHYLKTAANTTGTTLAVMPSVIAQSFTFTNATSNSRTIKINGGNGSGQLVVVKPNNFFAKFPENGKSYHAFNIFGTTIPESNGRLSNNLGDSCFIVFNRYPESGLQDSTFTLTNLKQNVRYYVYVFEYNGNTSQQYHYNPNYTSGQTWALFPEPTIQASNLTVTNITTNSMNVNWTKGNGQYSLVVASPRNSVDTAFDTFSYFANADIKQAGGYHNGRSVYIGESNNVTISNMESDSIYKIEVITFNGFLGAENYLNRNVPKFIHTTIAKEPTSNATGIEFSFEESPNPLNNNMIGKISVGNGKRRLVISRVDSNIIFTPTDTFAYLNNTLPNNQKIILNDTTAEFNINNILPERKYFFKVYEYNGSTPAANNYLINNAYSISRMSIALKPSIASSNVSFSNVTENSMRINFQQGNGKRRIIIARSLLAVNKTLVNGTHYTSNTNFGTGQDLGDNNYVIYSDTGNSVLISGLTPNTTYHFNIIEYNGNNLTGNDCSNSYLLNQITISSRTTLHPEPTISANNIKLSAFLNGSSNVTWTNGNGTNRIIIARKDSTISKVPLDGISNYIANNTYGIGSNLGENNYVVYIGNGNNFNMQGLDPERAYYLTVIEYNGTNLTTNYRENTFNIGSNLPIEPDTPSTEFKFLTINKNEMRFTFKKGNGSQRIVMIKESNVVSRIPYDGKNYIADTTYLLGEELDTGNYVIYIGKDDTVYVNGLKDSTTYHFAVFEFNEDSIGPPNYLTSKFLTAAANTKFGVVGIANTLIDQLSIYPNPSSDGYVWIDTKNERLTEILVYDLMGNEIEKIHFNSLEYKYLLKTPIVSNVYILKIKTNKKHYNKKIIVK